MPKQAMIGNWVRRGEDSKWHLVESVVAGDVVTHCGRRMDRTTEGGSLEVSQTQVFTRAIGQPQNCKRCS